MYRYLLKYPPFLHCRITFSLPEDVKLRDVVVDLLNVGHMYRTMQSVSAGKDSLTRPDYPPLSVR